jgi:uncharacterized membrane protein
METQTPAAPAARARRSGAINAALAATIVVVGLIFALDSIYTSWYAIFRVVHVALAVFWVGGGITLTVLGLRAERSDDPTEIGTLAGQAAWIGERLFAPAGLLVLLMGIGMIINGSIGWNHFWVIAGLVGYATTFVTGIAVLSPLAKTVNELAETDGLHHPSTQAAIRRILLIARVDTTVLVLVVADMVLKPFS